MARKRIERKKKEDKGGGWIMTFADLMSLLLCFFVLLLSFSEMDRQKFKVLSGSLSQAFGVQRLKVVWEMPAGFNIITRDFSKPELIDNMLIERLRRAARGSRSYANVRISKDEDANISIELPSQALFESGKAQLKEESHPLLDKLLEAIQDVPHDVMVIGHTDNSPMESPDYPSNWELSSARACAVLRYFLADDTTEPSRFSAVGKADTQPIAPNDTPENMAKNRRVQIILKKKIGVLYGTNVIRKKRGFFEEFMIKPSAGGESGGGGFIENLTTRGGESDRSSAPPPPPQAPPSKGGPKGFHGPAQWPF